jgi:acetoacetyl-CoA synthetase
MGDTDGYFDGAVASMDATNGTNGVSSGPKLLWKHPAPMYTPMFQFLVHVNQKYGLQLTSYDELHRWSTLNIGKFWGRVWDFVGVRAQKQGVTRVSHQVPERSANWGG